MADYNPYYYPATNTGLSQGGNKPTSQLVNMSNYSGSAMRQRMPRPAQPAQPQQPQGIDAGQMGGQIAGAAGAGVQAYNTARANTEGFETDAMAGHMGGLAGSGGGWLGMAAGAIGGYIGNQEQVNENLRNVNTNVNATGYDVAGNPIYQGQAVTDAAKTQQAIEDSIVSDEERVAQLFYAGGANIFDVIYGTNKKKKRKAEELSRNTMAAQQSYNQALQTNADRLQTQAAYRASQERLFSNPLGLPYNIY